SRPAVVFGQEAAYVVTRWLEFRRVLYRSVAGLAVDRDPRADGQRAAGQPQRVVRTAPAEDHRATAAQRLAAPRKVEVSVGVAVRSEERRVGQEGGRWG